LGGGVPTVARKRLTRIAQRLRREPTEAEKRLWSRLRSKQIGARFIRQFQIGDHVADLVCRSARLVIEVDGSQHVDCPEDDERTRKIEAFGYRVIRFWNSDVLSNTDSVIEAIMHELTIARNRAS